MFFLPILMVVYSYHRRPKIKYPALNVLTWILFLLYKIGRLYHQCFANCVLWTLEFQTPLEAAGEDEESYAKSTPSQLQLEQLHFNLFYVLASIKCFHLNQVALGYKQLPHSTGVFESSYNLWNAGSRGSFKSTGSQIWLLRLNPGFITYWLCDLRQCI